MRSAARWYDDMMTYRDFKILERAFCQEIIGGVLHSSSRAAVRLAHAGYLYAIDDRRGVDVSHATTKGYALTQKGMMAYCDMACKNHMCHKDTDLDAR